MGTRIPALIVVYGPSDGTEMLRLAASLRETRIEPTVYFSASSHALAEYLDMALLEGIRVFDASSVLTPGGVVPHARRAETPVPSGLNPGPGTRVREMLRCLPEPLKQALRPFLGLYHRVRTMEVPHPLVMFSREYKRLRDEIVDCIRILRALNPRVLVMPLEGLGHHSQCMAFAAHRLRIPTVVLPYTVPINVAEVGERFYPDPDYRIAGLINRIVAAFRPEWAREFRGRRILRLRAHEIIAQIRCEIAPPQPWRAGGMYWSDLVLIENEAMLSFYEREGFKRDRLTLAGSLADDILAESLRHKFSRRQVLYEELGLDPTKGLLLCSMVPDFTSRAGCEFGSYAELVEFWLATLGQLGRFNVVLRLHPSLRHAEFSGAGRWGVRVLRCDTARLVALSDVYVTSVSSTIRWAIACGVPVVNYDVYRFDYDDFRSVGGILSVNTRDAFREALRRIDGEPAKLDALREAQDRCKLAWGQLDGKSAVRIVAAIENLVDTHSGRS